MVWASMQENLTLLHVTSKTSDQPAHTMHQGLCYPLPGMYNSPTSLCKVSILSKINMLENLNSQAKLSNLADIVNSTVCTCFFNKYIIIYDILLIYSSTLKYF